MSAVAVATAVTLTVGMAAPESAGAGWKAGTTPVQAGGDAQKGAKVRSVTLITGDRVLVGSRGKVVGFLRAEGRENIPVQTRRIGKRTYVIPADAQRHIAAGKVDIALFDITELKRKQYRAVAGTGVPFIVTYKGKSPAAKSRLRAAADPEIRASLDAVNGEAVTVSEDDASAAWKALTGGSGVETISLDRVRKVALDKSVARIGAPTAWQAGYEGEGVRIAVLDTGIDTSHPDLGGGKVVAARDFSGSGSTRDRQGHGTHVASTAAGTGAKSKGRYKGVAPKAQLINAKVLDDQGYGMDSGIIEGMEWAVARGAKVVNLSLGGYDLPGIDPMEEAVNRLSETSGALFVIAAGNEGPGKNTISSPGSADSALTVGAVDRRDRVAEFSSIGLRTGDGHLKPDMTAPGVDIGAAAAKGSAIEQEGTRVADGYTAISGTSMATPHVAGAAALLAQQNPDWTGERIKAALTSSTKLSAGFSAVQQGSGRVDIARATRQTVIAETPSVSFGTTAWPHHDDKPVNRDVTYRNLGTKDVTLNLATETHGPTGKAAPKAMFSLGARQVTVPAGGTASVRLTADTTHGGKLDGAYSMFVTATGGGQTVRTAAAVNREPESYDLTLRPIGRDGKPAKEWMAAIVSEEDWFFLDSSMGIDKMRLPKGRYSVESAMPIGKDGSKGYDWLVSPVVNLTKKTAVTHDARKTKPITMTVPDKKAKSFAVRASYEIESKSYYNASAFGAPAGLRTAQVGKVPAGYTLNATAQSVHVRGTNEYHVAHARKGSFYTGLKLDTKKSQLATIKTRMGSSVGKRDGVLFTMPSTTWSATGTEYKLPKTATVHVRADKKTAWSQSFLQVNYKADALEAAYDGPERVLTAGKSYSQTFNTGVYGPMLKKYDGLFRDGDMLYGSTNPLADGAGNYGGSEYRSAKTTLYRNGKVYKVEKDPMDFVAFQLPKGKADYRLVTTVSRSGVAAVSTKVTSSISFTSARTKSDTKVAASAVRYAPKLGLDSRAKAGATLSVPVKVQGSAAGKNLKSLRIEVSVNGGKSWKKLTVSKGAVKVKNPKAGKSVSFRAKIVDKKGNTTNQTIIDAYRTK
ncbi:S8 family serine peptidase [Streptomyces durbertensis]|uniref:S8 family serine peptidase n=1 Tax=Streptomyces durbertensis TaxID=2448886 RepID=UPI002B208116|nr:S8 family serine peptidase [Streptomyces durbertensis]